MLTTPPVKKIDLHFPLGLEVTARNLKGVTIKDALDAIHKQFKKRVSLLAISVEASLILTLDRPTMSSTSHTLLASSGTRRSRGLVWWCTSKKTLGRLASAAAARRRRARRRTSNERHAPLAVISVDVHGSSVWELACFVGVRPGCKSKFGRWVSPGVRCGLCVS